MSIVGSVSGQLRKVLKKRFSSEAYRLTTTYDVGQKSVAITVQRKEVTTNMADDQTLEERVEQLEGEVAEIREALERKGVLPVSAPEAL